MKKLMPSKAKRLSQGHAGGRNLQSAGTTSLPQLKGSQLFCFLVQKGHPHSLACDDQLLILPI